MKVPEIELVMNWFAQYNYEFSREDNKTIRSALQRLESVLIREYVGSL